MLATPGGIEAGIRSSTHMECRIVVSVTRTLRREPSQVEKVKKLPSTSGQGLPTTRVNQSLRGKYQGVAKAIAHWISTNNRRPEQHSASQHSDYSDNNFEATLMYATVRPNML